MKKGQERELCRIEERISCSAAIALKQFQLTVWTCQGDCPFRGWDDLSDAKNESDESLTNHFESLPQKVAGRAVFGFGCFGGVPAESADVELKLGTGPAV